MAGLTHPLVIVEWFDCWGATTGWTPFDQLDVGHCNVTTVGFLLKNVNKYHYTIAQSRTDHGDYDNVIHIPTVNVVAITEVKRAV